MAVKREDHIVGGDGCPVRPWDILAHLPCHGHRAGLFIHDHIPVFHCGKFSGKFGEDLAIRVNIGKTKHDQFHDQRIIARVGDDRVERRRIFSDHDHDRGFSRRALRCLRDAKFRWGFPSWLATQQAKGQYGN